MAQPLSWLYELAADAQLENESTRAGAPPAASGAGEGRQRIIRYTLKQGV